MTTRRTAPAALESVLCTEQLQRRVSRPPDYECECRMLASLVRTLAESPAEACQAVADAILAVLRVDSAGISMWSEDEARFDWPAVAGVWTPRSGVAPPRSFSPCRVSAGTA